MKTALQDMLEWVRATFPMDLDTPRMIEDKIESLLDKEKEQIKLAFREGHDYCGEITSANYYNQTYDNEQK